MKNTQRFFIQGFTIFMILFLLLNCKSSHKSASKSIDSKASVEDFNGFYDKFHNDSVFQLSRIVFPLKGIKINAVDENEWNKDNWPLMKTRIYDIDTTQFKVEYKKTENAFTQQFWLKDSAFSSEYRFELIGNKWFLVYAMDSNL
jgi:hypothetical protein